MLICTCGLQLSNETVEKHDFDCANYTETQGLNALLGNDPFCTPVHSRAHPCPTTDFQLAIL
jgi:hypothetical protein